MPKKTTMPDSFISLGPQYNNDVSYESAYGDLFDDTGVSNPYSDVDINDYNLSRRGKMQYQQDLAEAEYLAQMQLMMYQNHYNSPAEQAKRQRAAGLNPDLNGVDNNSAATPAGVARPDVSGIKTNGEVALDGLGIVSSALSIASGALGGFFNLESLAQGVTGQKLDNLGKLTGAAESLAPLIAEGINLSPDFDVTAAINDMVDHSGLSRSGRKRLSSFLSTYAGSAGTSAKAWSNLSGERKSMADFAQHSVGPMYSGDIDQIRKCLEPVAEAEFKIAKMNLRNTEARLNNEFTFDSNFDPKLQAQSMNEQHSTAISDNKIKGILRSGTLKAVQQLEKAMKDGNKFAIATLTGLYAATAGYLHMPSVSYGSQSGPKGNSTTFSIK